MIEWINNTFGIENNISVPIIVSLLVFIIGGLVQFSVSIIRNAILKKRTRQTFTALLNKTIIDIKKEEIALRKFYPIFNIQHKGNWKLDHKLLGYLETFSKLNYQEVYVAFKRSWLRGLLGYKKRDEAFHLIWECLNNLKFVENRIEIELTTFQTSFNGFHQAYNNAFSQYREFHNKYSFEHNGLKYSEETKRQFEYLTKSQEIWDKWFQLGEPERIGYYSTFTHIVEPMLELNKEYSELSMANFSDNILVDCLHRYSEMLNSLETTFSKFYGIYFQYRICRRRIEKCLKILSKYP